MEKGNAMRDNKAYGKALKKLASQIARTIKVDTTYRNIPFGYSQLDIYSDGEIALLAVKVLSISKKRLNVQEFQIPSTKLKSFLIGAEMRKITEKIDVELGFHEKRIIKQISQGLAQLVQDSDRKKETWVFPFYNQAIVFVKDKSTIREDTLYFEGKTKRMKIDKNSAISIPVILFDVQGILIRKEEKFANSAFVHMSLDYQIYRTLTYNNCSFATVKDYREIAESSIMLDAA